MPWKTIRGHSYWYTSEREGGRVRSVYVGRGETAQTLAWCHRQRREEQDAQRALELAERQECRRVDDALDDVVAEARRLADEVMAVAGYHRHDRGPWRKRRTPLSTETPLQHDDPPGGGAGPMSGGVTPATTQSAGSSQGLPKVPAYFDNLLDDWVLELASKGANKDSPKVRSRVRRDITDCAAQLAGATPTPIEVALATTAALAWYGLRMAEGQLYGSEDMTIRMASHRMRAVGHAQRRYLSALRSLAAVRRLAAPTLMLNLAHNQQINTGPAGGN